MSPGHLRGAGESASLQRAHWRARGERRPSTTATSVLTRGPGCAEPLEAHAETVPVGKRTAREVQETVAPWRVRIRPTSPFPLGGRECTVRREANECATTSESIGRIRRTQSGWWMRAG